MKRPPAHGLILAGMQSGSGKTAVACMILAALAERGLAVQPFKVGPDFIDPGYHRHYAGIASRNLDAWMMGNEGIEREVRRHGAGRISIVEGVMGLFDGSEVASDRGSTMELARLLDWPVVLVIPSAKAGRSLGAALRGFIEEAGPGRIAGVILNQVSGSAHADYLREAIAPLRLPVLGAVPVCDELAWPERHLGLQASQERALPSRAELAAAARRTLDLDALRSMLVPAPACEPIAFETYRKTRIGIARDEAFHFYYESNLDHLRQRGAELVQFSPIRDASLPPGLDGLLFGGGFPEVFADALAQNRSLRAEAASAISAGMPCYAECGGLMWLAENLIALDGTSYPMAGVVPGSVEMGRKLHHFGYCTALEWKGQDGLEFRGHEFHCSRWREEAERANLWTARRNRSGSQRREGFGGPHLHASYIHLYFPNSAALFDSLWNWEPASMEAQTI